MASRPAIGRVPVAAVGTVVLMGAICAVALRCHDDSAPAAPRAALEQGTEDDTVHLSVRLGWLVNANSAGQLVAQVRGFYREEGLEVEFHEGGLVDPSVKTVSSGVDDIGFANAPDLVINARSNGAPLRIVAVIHREAYHAFFVRADSKIVHPRDWVGHSVGVKVGSPTYTLYLALVNKFNIDRAAIREVPLGFDLRPFLVGDIDVYPGALTNEYVTLSLQGLDVQALRPGDFGIPTMGNVVFATEAMCRDRPDVIRRFVRATMRGWEWCREPSHRELVLDYLQERNPAIVRAQEDLALDAALPLVGDGSIDTNRMEAIVGTLAEYRLLPRDVPIDALCWEAIE